MIDSELLLSLEGEQKIFPLPDEAGCNLLPDFWQLVTRDAFNASVCGSCFKSDKLGEKDINDSLKKEGK